MNNHCLKELFAHLSVIYYKSNAFFNRNKCFNCVIFNLFPFDFFQGPVSLCTLGVGSTFGECVLQDLPKESAVLTKTPCQLLRLQHPDIKALCEVCKQCFSAINFFKRTCGGCELNARVFYNLVNKNYCSHCTIYLPQ